MMGAQPMQQAGFNEAYGHSYGPAATGSIPAYPMQYAPPNAAYMGPPQMAGSQYAAGPPVGYLGLPGGMHSGMHSGAPAGKHRKGRLPGGQTNYMQQGGGQCAAAFPMAHPVHPSQPAGGAGHGMTYPAMQQRADAVQQFQMQQYQQMEASVMQQLQQKQDHALLKYGNFDNAQYRQQDMQSRPEFRTY